MSTNIGTLSAKITADGTDFAKNTAKAKKEAKDAADFISKSLGSVITALPIPSASGLFSGFKDEISEIVQLGKDAKKTGLGVNTLVGLQATGVDTDAMTAGLARFRRELGSVHDEASDLKSPFAGIGLSGLDLKKMSQENALGKVFDQLNKVDNEFTRGSRSFDIFGKSYSEMNRTISGGSSGLEKAQQTAKDFHLGVSKEDLEQAKAVKQALRDIDSVMAGVRRQAALAFAPLVTDLGKGLGDFLKDGPNLRALFDNLARTTAGWAADLLTVFRRTEDFLGKMESHEKVLSGEGEGFWSHFIAMKFPKDSWMTFADEWAGKKANEFRAGGSAPGTLERRLRASSLGQKDRPPGWWDEEVRKSTMSKGSGLLGGGAGFLLPDLKAQIPKPEDLSEVTKQANIYTAGLREQVEAMQLARQKDIDLADALEQVKLKNMDANVAILKGVDAQQKQNQMWKDAAKWTQQAINPIEAYGKEITRLNDALNAKAITWQTYTTGAGAATDALRNFVGAGQTKLPELVTAGSREAFDIIHRGETTDTQRDVPELLRQGNAKQDRAAKANEETARNTRGLRDIRIVGLSK